MAGIGRQFIINLIANAEPVEKAFERVGKAVGRIGVPVAAAVAGITAGFAAIGAAVFKVGSDLATLGEDFNRAYSIIRTGTGAVGSDFERLQDSFRNVAGRVSDSFDDVAIAIAETDRRLDLLSNRRLERVSQQFLDLAGLTGGDVAGTIREASRMMNRFGIEAHETSDFLDFLFKTSQATGISVEQLGAQTSNYGVGLQRLGFDLEESIVFLGMLEREGAAVSRIFPALNTAAGKLAREGTGDVRQGLADLIDELRELDDAAANARAAEMLGADYGNFLEVIRSNRLDFDGLVQQIRDSDATIAESASEADGLRDAWDGFKNFLKLQFEEPATLVFDNLKEVINGLKPIAEEVQEAYGEDGLAGALDVLQREWNRIYDENIEPLWTRFTDFLRDTVLPLAIEIGSDIGIGIARAIWDNFKETMRGFFWSEEIAANVGGIDVQSEIERQLGVPESRTGLAPTFSVPFPETIPNNRPRVGGGGGGRIMMMAEGGVVTSPTLSIIGEAGPEAVIPLDRMGQMGSTNVYVTVTSADPNAVVDAIRKYTRANGPLGQVVPV